jgi:hypothetical protein
MSEIENFFEKIEQGKVSDILNIIDQNPDIINRQFKVSLISNKPITRIILFQWASSMNVNFK